MADLRRHLVSLLLVLVCLSQAAAAQTPVPQPPTEKTPSELAQELQVTLDKLKLQLPPVIIVLPPTATVRVGESLQAAIDKAAPGSTIFVQPGVYAPITLREKVGAIGWITIRPDVAVGAFPADGVRMTPAFAPVLIKLRSTTGTAVIRTDPRAAYYRLIGIEGASTGLDHHIVDFGSATETELANVPHHLVLDRCYLHGDNAQRRGVALNSASTEIINSHIDGVLQPGRDTQAIGGWNGPGPFLIENNYLAGATETLMFGGGDPAILGLVPSDIVIRGNTLTKDLQWRPLKGVVKNVLELKNAQRVLVEFNIIEYSWVDGQTGFLIVLTPRNQDGRCPWCTVREVEIRQNVIRHGNAGLSVMGRDDTPGRVSVPLDQIHVHHNLFYDLVAEWGGGSTKAIQISTGGKGITIDHNTISGRPSSFLAFTGALPLSLVTGLVFTNNVVFENAYGIVADGASPGVPALARYAPDATFTNNVIVKGNVRTVKYPLGNALVGALALDPTFHLDAIGRAYPTTDGTPVGADIAVLLARLPGLQIVP